MQHNYADDTQQRHNAAGIKCGAESQRKLTSIIKDRTVEAAAASSGVVVVAAAAVMG